MDKKLSDLAKIMVDLRNVEKGCPWDKEQTHESLKPYLIEEAYEVLEAIESGEDALLKEELGDLLFQVIFHSQLAKENGRFTIENVIATVSEKMIRRHPHVFGSENAENSSDVLSRWEEIKKEEKKRDSILEGVPRSLPSLIRAKRLMDRAARVGFEWDKVEDVWKKVEEEWQEIQDAREKGDDKELKEEIGDLMIALVNLGRFLKIDADEALTSSVEKFIRRFSAIEKELKANGKDIHEATLEEMDEIWNRVRQEDKRR